jgi:hypothetical protein
MNTKLHPALQQICNCNRHQLGWQEMHLSSRVRFSSGVRRRCSGTRTCCVMLMSNSAALNCVNTQGHLSLQKIMQTQSTHTTAHAVVPYIEHYEELSHFDLSSTSTHHSRRCASKRPRLFMFECHSPLPCSI